MTIYQFMGDHPMLTVCLGYFAMLAIIGSAEVIAAAILGCRRK
jgi:anthranilate/para-aminobenzoate synthase component II